MLEIPLWMPLCFFLIALLYSMLGFGGGSSYLAVLVLAGLDYQKIPPVALFCNWVVAGGGCWHFSRAGHFKAKAILPFVVFSIPAAYWGGRLAINKELFSLLLGICLLIVAFRLFIPAERFETTKEISWKQAWGIGLPMGAGLGFLSGLVGIGGGIFLSPLLLLMRWVNVKEAAAGASFFIVVNSLAGLAGQLEKGAVDLKWLIPLGLAVFLGGQMGSRLGAYQVPSLKLEKALAFLLLYVSLKLLLEAA